MGAHDFQDEAIGRTMAEAYGAAVESAQYEYGHDAYNGTISTTSGCVSIDAILKPFSAARREVIAQCAIGVQRFDPQYDEKPKRGDYDVLHTYEGWNGRGQYLVPKQVKPAERDACVEVGLRVEKWGPALGYEITGKRATEIKRSMTARGYKTRGRKVYRFVGLAAS